MTGFAIILITVITLISFIGLVGEKSDSKLRKYLLIVVCVGIGSIAYLTRLFF